MKRLKSGAVADMLLTWIRRRDLRKRLEAFFAIYDGVAPLGFIEAMTYSSPDERLKLDLTTVLNNLVKDGKITLRFQVLFEGEVVGTYASILDVPVTLTDPVSGQERGVLLEECRPVFQRV